MGPLIVVELEVSDQFPAASVALALVFSYTSSYFTVRHDRSTKMLQP